MENYIIYPKQLRRSTIPVEKNRCFFLMPFSHDFDIVYGKAKGFLNENGFICNRADEISGSTPIISKILTEIMKSQYIIVDITNSNPNVYYELGIAHTLKEARNVLLIKRKDYKAPFDISHLTYIEYEPSNILLLISTIHNFIKESQKKNSFYEALNMRKIINYIDDNDNDFVEYIQCEIPDLVPVISKALLGEGEELKKEQLNELIASLRTILNSAIGNHDYKIISKIVDVYFELIVTMPEQECIQDFVSTILDNYFLLYNLPEITVNDFKTRLALKLAQNNIYLSTVLPWIINYFSRSKSTTIDLNRYKIESLLMTTTSNVINDTIINSLCNPDCYIREHMADIIGEKKLVNAAGLLCAQLRNEENYFTAQSMMEAIGKIGYTQGIEAITSWIKIHKKHIIDTNQLFVLKHALFAIAKLDHTDKQIYVTAFNNEFGALLRNYYIV
jgi:hypothetical protein